MALALKITGLDDTQQQLSDEELEALMQEEDPPAGNRLQSEYERYNRPDRLRVVNDAGQFYDVIVMGDSIGIQPISFTPDYSQVIEYHRDFNTAKDMLDMVAPGWYVQTGINASNKPLNAPKRLTYAGALTLIAGAIIAIDVEDYEPYAGLDEETIQLLKEDPDLQEFGPLEEYEPSYDWDEKNNRRRTREEIEAEEAQKEQKKIELKKKLNERQKRYEEEIGEPAGYDQDTDSFYPLRLDYQRDLDILEQYENNRASDGRLYVRDISEMYLYNIIPTTDGKFRVQPLPLKIDYSEEPIFAESQEDVKQILDNALGKGWKYWNPTEEIAAQKGVTGSYVPRALLQLSAALVQL